MVKTITNQILLFDKHKQRHNHDRLRTVSVLLSLLSIMLGLSLDTWIVQSAIIDSPHEIESFKYFLLYLSPSLCIFAHFIIKATAVSKNINLLCLILLSSNLSIINTVALTSSLTYAPVSVISMTLIAKVFLLKRITLILIFSSNFFLTFITIETFHPSINLGVDYYLSTGTIIAWVFYLANDHYKNTQDFFIKTIKEKQLLKEVTLKNMQIAASNTKLAQITYIDFLSGLYNRRYFDKKLTEEISRSKRSKSRVGLLLVDIDHFKKVNDKLGHDVGDKYIQLLASTLKSCARRPEDIVTRYGGEEFAFILPNTDKLGLEKICRNVMSKVQELDLPHPDGNRLTVSIGGSSLCDNVNCEKSLFKAADNHLYYVKRSTRNNYSIHQ